MTLEVGAHYEGEVNEAGLPHGKGATTIPGGGRHEGAYRDGYLSGQGVFAMADGTRIEGLWQSKPQDGAIVTAPDGTSERIENGWLAWLLRLPMGRMFAKLRNRVPSRDDGE